MKNPLYLSIFVLALSSGCSQESIPKHESGSASAASNTVAGASVAAAIFDEPRPSDMYRQFAWLQRKTAAELAAAPNQAAGDRIYDAYRQQSNALLNQINEAQTDVLQDFYVGRLWTYDEKKQELLPTDELKQKQAHLAQVGLRYADVGEGMAEIMPQGGLVPQLFADKVSPDYQAYIRQQDFENQNLATADAALVIPWTEIGERVAFWENFIAQYPQSAWHHEAKQLFAFYSSAFLFGLDNTPVIDPKPFKQGDVKDELLRGYEEINHAWQVFVRQYPQSRVSAWVPQAQQIAALPDEARLAAIRQWRATHFPDAGAQ